MVAYRWQEDGRDDALTLVWVPGTDAGPHDFGHAAWRRPVNVAGFYIATTPVTQALWQKVMGENPAVQPDPRAPVENVSFDHDGCIGFRLVLARAAATLLPT